MTEDYWYENQHKLEPDMIFVTCTNEVVKLDRRVPGDGTKWYVADLDLRGWSYWDGTIEPGELKCQIR